MSNQDNVFVEPTANQTPNTTDNQDSIASTLVGEGKKFKTVDDLAKGKLEADLYVEQLKKQLESKDAELTKLGNADEKFTKILQGLEQSKNTPNTQGNTQVPALGKEDIATLVRNQMTLVEAERTAQQNIDSTNSKLKDLFGDKAKDVVQSKAKELGISMEELKILSAKSPTAFFTMIGATESRPQSASTPNPNGSVNTASNFNQDFKVGTKEYYNNLRRTMKPVDYYTKIQPEIMERVKKGELVL